MLDPIQGRSRRWNRKRPGDADHSVENLNDDGDLALRRAVADLTLEKLLKGETAERVNTSENH